jgi:hypothetical protein
VLEAGGGGATKGAPRDGCCRAGAHHSHRLHQEHCGQQQAARAPPQSADEGSE